MSSDTLALELSQWDHEVKLRVVRHIVRRLGRTGARGSEVQAHQHLTTKKTHRNEHMVITALFASVSRSVAS